MGRQSDLVQGTLDRLLLKILDWAAGSFKKKRQTGRGSQMPSHNLCSSRRHEPCA